jgi:hypothetical protein
MQVRAERIEHRGAVARAVQLRAQGIPLPPLHGVVVMALQVLAVGPQVALMALADGDAGVAFHPVAVDTVAIDAVRIACTASRDQSNRWRASSRPS